MRSVSVSFAPRHDLPRRFRTPHSTLRTKGRGGEGGSGVWWRGGEVVSPCRSLESAARSRSPTLPHRRHLDGRGRGRRVRRGLELRPVRRGGALARLEGRRGARSLRAREGRVRRQYLQARAAAAHHRPARPRCAVRRPRDSSHRHGDGRRFGGIDSVRGAGAGRPAHRGVVRLLRATTLFPARPDRARFPPTWWWRSTSARDSTSRLLHDARPSRRWCGRTARPSA